MKTEEYREHKVDAAGWEVNLKSYRVGDVFHCVADNVSPGAWLARATGSTRDEAENKALTEATRLLGKTRRHSITT